MSLGRSKNLTNASTAAWSDAAVVNALIFFTAVMTIAMDAARLSMQVENVPSEDNPRTGRLTALSVIAALKKLSSPLAIGT
jgi:aspartate dehydrogenase